MSKIPENKNDFTIWLNTNEGLDCLQPQDFTKPGSTKYLENRLWYAWTAGMAKQAEHSLERIAELEKEVERLKVMFEKEYKSMGKIYFEKYGLPDSLAAKKSEECWDVFKKENKL